MRQTTVRDLCNALVERPLFSIPYLHIAFSEYPGLAMRFLYAKRLQRYNILQLYRQPVSVGITRPHLSTIGKMVFRSLSITSNSYLPCGIRIEDGRNGAAPPTPASLHLVAIRNFHSQFDRSQRDAQCK